VSDSHNKVLKGEFMIHSRTIRLLAILSVLAFTAGCDQATKHLARSGLSQYEAKTYAGGLVEFTLAENRGAFLSLGGTLPQAVRVLLAGAVAIGLVALLVFLLRSSRLNRAAFVALTLAWAGGVSNLIDRVARHGAVTDFMVLRAGPLHTGIFNVADLAIVIGVILLCASSYLGSDTKNAAPKDLDRV
jgi:signal peptidase II